MCVYFTSNRCDLVSVPQLLYTRIWSWALYHLGEFKMNSVCLQLLGICGHCSFCFVCCWLCRVTLTSWHQRRWKSVLCVEHSWWLVMHSRELRNICLASNTWDMPKSGQPLKQSRYQSALLCFCSDACHWNSVRVIAYLRHVRGLVSPMKTWQNVTWEGGWVELKVMSHLYWILTLILKLNLVKLKIGHV